MTKYYIGIMSGNSLDAMDAVLVDFACQPCNIIASHSTVISQELRSMVQSFDVDSNISVMLGLDNEIAGIAVTAVAALLAKTNIEKEDVVAIGFHGQTLCHLPQQYAATLQIGNPHIVAVQTGIDVVADFRRRDIAEGGQGAPLAPLFHSYAFADQTKQRCIVNIGGIANITMLDAGGAFIAGFDTGPGNILLDGFMQQYYDQLYDTDGLCARSGAFHADLLAVMLQAEFFQKAWPKSTGREEFNNQWLHSLLPPKFNPADIICTLTHLTAKSIATAINGISSSCDIIVCGGGAYNNYLLELIRQYAGGAEVVTTASLNLQPQLVEAVAFAYLAMQHRQQQPVDLGIVTGARRPYVIGVSYSSS